MLPTKIRSSLLGGAIPRGTDDHRRAVTRKGPLPRHGIDGPSHDAQVIVLGIHDGHTARFVKRYADMREQMVAGVHAFAEDVRARRYPEPVHGYTMAPDERERLRELLAARSAADVDALDFEL